MSHEDPKSATVERVERVRDVRGSFRGDKGPRGLEIWQGLLEGRRSLADLIRLVRGLT